MKPPLITTLDANIARLPELKSTADVLALFGICLEREGLFTHDDQAVMALANDYWIALKRLAAK